MQQFYIYFIRLWECEIFSDKRLINNFPTTIGKDEHRTTSCESCEQPVRSNALQEAVGRGCPQLQCHSK